MVTNEGVRRMSMSGTGVVGGDELWCKGGTGSNGYGRCKEAALAGDTGTPLEIWARFAAPTNGARN